MESLNETNAVLMNSPQFKNLQKERDKMRLSKKDQQENDGKQPYAQKHKLGKELISLIDKQSDTSKQDKSSELFQENQKLLEEIVQLNRKIDQLEEENNLLEGWNKEVESENQELTTGLAEFEALYKSKEKELGALKKAKQDYINRIAMFTR